MVIFLTSLAGWLEGHAMPCVYKKYFGMDCPGCGMQRAIIELLRGNVIQSLYDYPACIPLMLMVLFLGLHILFHYRNGARIVQWMFILNACIIFFNYIYKQL